jgi:hypothetical protein
MKQRVLVCGGRDYSNDECLRAVLDRAHAANPIVALMQGGARGADSLAAQWARDHDIPEVITFHADWERHGKAAGAIRNKLMLDAGKPDIVIAFPGGKGTANMVKQAKERGVPVAHVL